MDGVAICGIGFNIWASSQMMYKNILTGWKRKPKSKSCKEKTWRAGIWAQAGGGNIPVRKQRIPSLGLLEDHMPTVQTCQTGSSRPRWAIQTTQTFWTSTLMEEGNCTLESLKGSDGLPLAHKGFHTLQRWSFLPLPYLCLLLIEGVGAEHLCHSFKSSSEG